MADSLRDQLIAAGFEAPKKKPDNQARNKKRAGQSNDKHKPPGGAKRKHAGNGPSSNKGTSNNSSNNKGPSNKGSSNNRSAGNRSGGKHAAGGKGNQAKNAQAEELALERKKLKAKIKELIDTHQLKEWKGEVTYRYLVDKRIRELYVNEAAHKQLAAREVAITRLNGDTYLVPLAIATEIKQVNPQWSVFNTDAEVEDTTNGDEEYSEFQVPDDLQW